MNPSKSWFAEVMASRIFHANNTYLKWAVKRSIQMTMRESEGEVKRFYVCLCVCCFLLQWQWGVLYSPPTHYQVSDQTGVTSWHFMAVDSLDAPKSAVCLSAPCEHHLVRLDAATKCCDIFQCLQSDIPVHLEKIWILWFFSGFLKKITI